jgi:glycosyltransferase involved in cell wall biosynthesis
VSVKCLFNKKIFYGKINLKKTIDVIIPAYNAEKFIERTIESVLSQTYLLRKIIVIDDGSIDKTVEVVENISKISKIPIVLISQENKGPNAARNTGLEHSDSEFIALLDADDIWKEEKLQKQIEVFEQSEFENLGLVYCGYELVDEKGEYVNKKNILPCLKGKVFNQLLKSNLISGSCSSVLIKKECFEEVGLFDEKLRGSEDWDMWLRISKHYEFDYVDEPLVYITDRGASNNKNFEKMLDNRIKFLNKWMEEIKKERELVAFHRNKIIMLAIRCKMGKFSFNIVENIEKTMIGQTKELFFGKGSANILKYIPVAIFNCLRERFS